VITAQVGEYQTLRILGLQGFLGNLHSEYPFFSIIFHKQIEGTRNFFPQKNQRQISPFAEPPPDMFGQNAGICIHVADCQGTSTLFI